MLFVCGEDHELLHAVRRSYPNVRRFDRLEDALSDAVDGEALLCLSESYPLPALDVPEAALEACRKKGLRAYFEYPRSFPGTAWSAPSPTEWERAVVSSGFFSPGVERDTILSLSGCWYLRDEGAWTQDKEVHVVVARVAGYDKAEFGIPRTAAPILVELPDPKALVATSCLSNFAAGRYAPLTLWKEIWRAILGWLTGAEFPAIDVAPAVRTQAGPDDPLSEGFEEEAFRRSISWFVDHALFSRDRRKGAIEGYQSEIDHRGRQEKRVVVRADCVAESAMTLAFAARRSGAPDLRRLAARILDYLWDEKDADFVQGNPHDPAYGLVNWYERGEVFYGDDNARVILASLTAARLLGDERWDERILRCALANLRTTGTLGFRRNRINRAHFLGHDEGWRRFRNEEWVYYGPHYQCYLWASFLWLHGLTGHDVFIERTLTAVRMTMEAYPRWKWTNGITQEIARMILPLAFLVRIDPDPLYRSWLDRLTGDLLAQMEPCGAIREKLGDPEYGVYRAPASNEEYGTTEAPVIQRNGDPATDLLYTMNFAFLGLHEAAAATGDPALRSAVDRMAEFFCRIQVRSERHPYLDGAWMRSFDFRYWEYWGSSADAGWGPWCVESGWTNSWIASVLAMRLLGDTLFNLDLSERMRRLLPELLQEMELAG